MRDQRLLKSPRGVTFTVGPAFRLNIGGFAFHVTGESTPLAAPDEPAYREFLSPAAGVPPEGSIAARVLDGAAPSPPEGAPAFDSGSAWRLYAEGGRKTIFHGIPGRGGGHLWAAEIADGGREVTVTCGPAMERTVGGTHAIENPLRYPLDQILVMLLLGGEGIIVHAAGAVREGRAVVMAGVSGAGKTTVSRRLRNDGRCGLLSDDRVIIRRDGEGFSAHGTPWPGEGGFASCAHAPLGQLCLLKKGTADIRRELTPRESLERILPALSLPWFDRTSLDASLGFVDDLLRKVPALELTFAKQERGTDLLFREK